LYGAHPYLLIIGWKDCGTGHLLASSGEVKTAVCLLAFALLNAGLLQKAELQKYLLTYSMVQSPS